MSDLFLTLVNMSITAGWISLAVILLRLILKRAPKRLCLLLWALVGLRLALPFSIESAFSLIPSTRTIDPERVTAGDSAVQSGFPAMNRVISEEVLRRLPSRVNQNPDFLFTAVQAASVIWLIGAAAMVIYAVVSYLRLRSRVKTAVPLQKGVFQSEYVASPFVLGIVRPLIYLPFAMPEQAVKNAVAHEKAHIKRRDHIIKPVAYLFLCVYWFNPLLWIAYMLLSRDIELACDEKVIQNLDRNERADYSEALLSCCLPRRLISACPLAFGGGNVRKRVENILGYRKPSFWIIVTAGILCVIAAVCFLTNPVSSSPSFDRITITKAVASDSLTGRSSDLDGEQISALTSMLQGLNMENKYASFSSLLPRYSLTVQAKDTPEFTVSSFATDGDPVALKYENSYYRIDDDAFAGFLGSLCAIPEKSQSRQALSLNDVITLSQKGETLSWEDFDAYSYFETGSGLYIRVYEIDQQFSLWIGGGPTDQKPMYLRLVNEQGLDDYIDIRFENVLDFITRVCPEDLPSSSEPTA